MVAPYPEAVTVAAGHEDRQLVIGEFQTSGYRQGPAVQSVHAVGIYVAGKIG